MYLSVKRERERDGGPLHEKSEKEGLCELHQSREPWNRESRSFGYRSTLSQKKNELIMLGRLDPNGYETVNRVYDSRGISPTLQSRDYKDPIKMMVKMIKNERYK